MHTKKFSECVLGRGDMQVNRVGGKPWLIKNYILRSSPLCLQSTSNLENFLSWKCSPHSHLYLPGQLKYWLLPEASCSGLTSSKELFFHVLITLTVPPDCSLYQESALHFYLNVTWAFVFHYFHYQGHRAKGHISFYTFCSKVALCP